jgi:bla regulator protein BlaR1
MIAGLTNHLWQSTWFAVAAGLLTVAFHKNRAQVRHWLWFSASFKFLVPFALLTTLGSHLQWVPPAQQIVTQIAAPAASFTMMQISQPFSGTLPLGASTRGARGWALVAILGVWACGFASVALIRLRGWLRIRTAIRVSVPIDIPATVAVRSSPGLLEPGVVGWLRPILLLPAGIAGRLTPPQLEAVLAHELCHVRRRDNLFASIHMMVEAMFWFHPLVWWIGAKLVEERERACDEEVLSLGSEPHVYAEGIVNVCKLYVESPLVCVSGVTGSNLNKRIEAIMSNRIVLRLNFAKKIALTVAGIAALAVPIAVGVMNAPLIRAQSAAAAVPKFEASSIRPCNVKPGLMLGAGYSSSAGRLNTGCMPLVDAANLGIIQRA